MSESALAHRHLKKLWQHFRLSVAKSLRLMVPLPPMRWGLTQQVPIREAYLTSGRTRTLKLGQTEVLVKHAPAWMLALGSRPAGAAVRALAWLGPTQAQPSLSQLHQSLPAEEWQLLMTSRATLPSWMARAIGEESTRD